MKPEKQEMTSMDGIEFMVIDDLFSLQPMIGRSGI